jgi:tetrahydromethanopterin S-methyltransferase subunit G
MSEEHENDNARIVSNKEYNEILTRLDHIERDIKNIIESITILMNK